jgi:hypothetical protein
VPAAPVATPATPTTTESELPFGLVAVTDELVIPPRDWLVDGLWPKQAIGFIGGPPKAGKSFLSLDLVIAVACGKPFLGRPTSGPQVVLYFLGEEFLGDVLKRLDQLLAGRGMTRSDLGGRLFFAPRKPCLESQEDTIALADLVKAMKPALVVLDPLERFLRQGDTNTSKDMRVVNNYLRDTLTRTLGASVAVIHHTDKKGFGLRGTGDFRAVSETTLLLSEPSSGRVRVSVEMRGASPPDPFYLSRKFEGDCIKHVVGAAADGTGGSAALEAERVTRVRELLVAAAPSGLTTTAIRNALKIRLEVVPGLLERAGAVRVGKRGRWVLPSALSLAPKPEPASRVA